ncbi:MAG TPA: dihydrofolate reductase family protein, partial [Candidatus Caenarcaniphilales bacterium]
QLRFFRQAVPRWLLTTTVGAASWGEQPGFAKILVNETPQQAINWVTAFKSLTELGLEQLAVLGGGELIASLLAVDFIDELRLTICPLILGGVEAPTPVEGPGFLSDLAPRLELLAVQQVEQELFLHYRLLR